MDMSGKRGNQVCLLEVHRREEYFYCWWDYKAEEEDKQPVPSFTLTVPVGGALSGQNPDPLIKSLSWKTQSDLPINSHKCFPSTSYCMHHYYGIQSPGEAQGWPLWLNRRCGEGPAGATWLKQKRWSLPEGQAIQARSQKIKQPSRQPSIRNISSWFSPVEGGSFSL